MGCFKRLGEKVSARTFERQVVELNIRAAILNRSCSNQQQLAICQNAGFAYFQRSFGAGCHPTTIFPSRALRGFFICAGDCPAPPQPVVR